MTDWVALVIERERVFGKEIPCSDIIFRKIVLSDRVHAVSFAGDNGMMGMHSLLYVRRIKAWNS